MAGRKKGRKRAYNVSIHALKAIRTEIYLLHYSMDMRCKELMRSIDGLVLSLKDEGEEE